MNYNISVDPHTNWGRVTIQGELTAEDLKTSLVAAWTDPVYASVEYAIWDFRQALADISFEQMAKLAEFIGAQKGGRGSSVLAVVVSRHLEFGLGRMFGVLEDAYGYQVRVFFSMDEAEGFLRESSKST